MVAKVSRKPNMSIHAPKSVGALTRAELQALSSCHLDRYNLYEFNNVKIIAVGGLEAEIINVHDFTHHPSRVH